MGLVEKLDKSTFFSHIKQIIAVVHVFFFERLVAASLNPARSFQGRYLTASLAVYLGAHRLCRLAVADALHSPMVTLFFEGNGGIL